MLHPTTCNVLCTTKLGLGVRIRARLVGPCAHTWAVCGEVSYIQPCLELKKVQSHVTILNDRSNHIMCVIPLLTLTVG